MSFIELKNITKTFNGVAVLKDLNVEIEEGSVLGILGKSGCGKSVLINMLRGTKEYKPDSGKMIFNIAVCDECLRVEPPSKVGSLCECGGKFKAKLLIFGMLIGKTLQRFEKE